MSVCTRRTPSRTASNAESTEHGDEFFFEFFVLRQDGIRKILGGSQIKHYTITGGQYQKSSRINIHTERRFLMRSLKVFVVCS